ncbi:MAG: hypothetical protein M1308_23220 [Actinobacteria bacterium]|nr:hypothetical protein [Actinomycetota bacterium]
MRRLVIILFFILTAFASFYIGSSNLLEVVQGIRTSPSPKPTEDNAIIFDENDFGNKIQESQSPPEQNTEVKGETVENVQNVPEYSPPPIITAMPTEIPPIKPDNSSKLMQIGSLFEKIGSLNNDIFLAQSASSMIASSSEPCDKNKWGQQYLPNGEKNPNYVFDPHVVDDLYNSCLKTKQEIANMSAPTVESLKNQIKDIDKQIQGIISTCIGNECNDYYWRSVQVFESNGWIVR